MRLRIAMFVAVAATFLLVGNATAQNFNRGIEFLDARMYATAKVYFLEEIKETPSAEAYYCLGNAYLYLDKVDSAAYYFTKSKEVNPTYVFAEIGLVGLKLKQGDKATADGMVAQIIKDKAAKKNPTVFTAIAKVYALNGMDNEADAMIAGAFKAKSNFPDAYIAKGDILYKNKEYNEALQQYDQAEYFDKGNKSALLRKAIAYLRVNKYLSIETLEELVAKDPEYYPAYAELADYYYDNQEYEEAIEPLSKVAFVKGMPVYYAQNYAGALYFTHQYDKSLEVIKTVLNQDPSNFIMRRLQFYNNNDKAVGENGEINQDLRDLAYSQAQEFFSNKKATDNYTSVDYMVYGTMLQDKKEYAKSNEIFEKLITLDSSKLEFLKEIAYNYDLMEEYPQAIATIEKYLANPKKTTAGDFFSFGRTYYLAASKVEGLDSVTINHRAMESARMYDSVIVHNPDSYLGYIWKARAVNLLDPEFETGVAFDAYSIAMPEVEKAYKDKPEEGRIVIDLLECYRYLGNYYYNVKEDTKNAVVYLEKMQTVRFDKGLAEAINELKKHI